MYSSYGGFGSGYGGGGLYGNSMNSGYGGGYGGGLYGGSGPSFFLVCSGDVDHLHVKNSLNELLLYSYRGKLVTLR
jgi:uncharacterized spore protein YtfJ